MLQSLQQFSEAATWVRSSPGRHDSEAVFSLDPLDRASADECCEAVARICSCCHGNKWEAVEDGRAERMHFMESERSLDSNNSKKLPLPPLQTPRFCKMTSNDFAETYRNNLEKLGAIQP